MSTYSKCPWCGRLFEALGGHWRYNPGHAPDPTDRQKEIITGLLLGAGAYTGPLNSPSVRLNIESSSLAKWLRDELDSLVADVQSNEEKIRVTTPANPSLKPYFRNWYSDQDDPRPPSTSRLTPLVAGIWYSVNGKPKNGAIHLKASYSSQNLGWHRENFREVGFNPWKDKPWLIFPVEQAKNLIDYMKGPFPGAGEKWDAIKTD